MYGEGREGTRYGCVDSAGIPSSPSATIHMLPRRRRKSHRPKDDSKGALHGTLPPSVVVLVVVVDTSIETTPVASVGDFQELAANAKKQAEGVCGVSGYARRGGSGRG